MKVNLTAKNSLLKQAGKKERGLGEGIFTRLLFGFAKNFSEDDGLAQSKKSERI